MMIDLDLSDRPALVVGLGAVGRRKAEALAESGAQVIGVDPSPPAEGLPDRVEILAEPYHAGHLRGMALAFAAAPAEVNRRVVADARAAGVLVNSASDPDAGDFTLPATWREGPLSLAVSTSGASPALASALRDRAASALGPAAAGLAALLAELRPIALARLAYDPAARRRLLTEWADLRRLDLWAAEGPEAVRLDLLRALDETERKPRD